VSDTTTKNTHDAECKLQVVRILFSLGEFHAGRFLLGGLDAVRRPPTCSVGWWLMASAGLF
jgi:hypothetical protein